MQNSTANSAAVLDAPKAAQHGGRQQHAPPDQAAGADAVTQIAAGELP